MSAKKNLTIFLCEACSYQFFEKLKINILYNIIKWYTFLILYDIKWYILILFKYFAPYINSLCVKKAEITTINVSLRHFSPQYMRYVLCWRFILTQYTRWHECRALLPTDRIWITMRNYNPPAIYIMLIMYVYIRWPFASRRIFMLIVQS